MTHPGIDSAAFRELLGRFATGVTVLTTSSPAGDPLGMTANSLTSVSLDPPLVSVCIDHRAEMFRGLAAAEGFVINVLTSDQESVSRRFSGAREDRFQGVGYRTSEDGYPILEGVLAHMECTRHACFEAGDHTVFIGRVIGGHTGPGRPLLFYRGGYAELESP